MSGNHMSDKPRLNSDESSHKELDQLLIRIQRRRAFLKTVRSLEGAICVAIMALTVLIIADKVYEPVTTLNQKLWAAGGLFSLFILLARLRADSSTIAGAVEVEGQVNIPQTISTAIYAREGKLSEDAARKVLEDAGEVSGSVDLSTALPVGRLWPGKALWICLLFFGGSLFLPAIDLFGTQAAIEEERKENARVMRKEKALVRRLEKVEEISQKHDVSDETREVIRKITRQQKRNLELSKSENSDIRKSEDLKDQLKQQLSKVAAAKKASDSEESAKMVKRMKEDIESIRQQSSAEMKKLAKALQEGDVGQIATALDALAKKFSDDPAAMESLQEELQKMLGQKFGKPGQAGSGKEELANDLEQLSQMLKDLALLDQVKEQLEFTEAELSQLAKEWPKGNPPQICPDCLAGKCQANSGGT
ncbi:hypothetical protein CBD41_06800 [bacterium TMED181]|nr:hypothetical protein [Planctomycetota bacterium]OUW43735.1 MAG: hypothetical protein CBD41_06800 [bacterium TMED181]